MLRADRDANQILLYCLALRGTRGGAFDEAQANFTRLLTPEAVEVREQQDIAREQVRAKKMRFLGRQRVLDTSPYKRAKSYEHFGQCVPTFASGKGQRNVFNHAVKELKVFHAMYRDAIKAWKKGLKNVFFPQGTWWMVQFHKVCTAPLQI